MAESFGTDPKFRRCICQSKSFMKLARHRLGLLEMLAIPIIHGIDPLATQDPDSNACHYFNSLGDKSF